MFRAGRIESWENGQNLKSSIRRRETRTTSGLRMGRKIPVKFIKLFWVCSVFLDDGVLAWQLSPLFSDVCKKIQKFTAFLNAFG